MINLYFMQYDLTGKGFSGESCGSDYDLSEACPVCGTRAKLIDNLRSKGINKVNKEIFATMDGDDIISQKLYEILKEKGIKVGNLIQVTNTKNELLPFYHLKSNFYLPKMSSKTRGIIIDEEMQCKLCKQDSYFGTVKENPFVFYKEFFYNYLKESSIFCTWEHFGLSNLKEEGMKVIRYARPHLIVTEKFKNSIEELGLKYVIFNPVIVENVV